jgi:hypothetical protein
MDGWAAGVIRFRRSSARKNARTTCLHFRKTGCEFLASFSGITSVPCSLMNFRCSANEKLSHTSFGNFKAHATTDEVSKKVRVSGGLLWTVRSRLDTRYRSDSFLSRCSIQATRSRGFASPEAQSCTESGADSRSSLFRPKRDRKALTPGTRRSTLCFPAMLKSQRKSGISHGRNQPAPLAHSRFHSPDVPARSLAATK